jgi:hypothetical protein
MPVLILFLVKHAAIGFALAVVFVATLVGLDVDGLGTLVEATVAGRVAGLMLVVLTGSTFAATQIGFAIMLLGEETDAG